MKIKICGLTSLNDISYVNEALPDFIGFIFAESSRRKITINNALEMKKLLDKRIKSVGVFVNEDIKTIADISSQGIINLIQLHGSEDNGYINEIKKITSLPVIKAFKAQEADERTINSSLCDYVLIDSYDGNSFGGTGKTFNWGIIPKNIKKPLFLAGGLNYNNVDKAIKNINPYCLDINSGVETNGIKDREKILNIVNKIKGYKNE